jgi:hypothetical protein
MQGIDLAQGPPVEGASGREVQEAENFHRAAPRMGDRGAFILGSPPALRAADAQ